MDIEEDIKIVKEFNKNNRFRDCGRINNAIDNLLAEREEDKKRIEELEDENKVQRHQIMTVYDNGYVHKDKIKEDYIPKQKVEEKIEENNKLIEKCKDELEHYGEIYLYEHDNKILKELLEDK